MNGSASDSATSRPGAAPKGAELSRSAGGGEAAASAGGLVEALGVWGGAVSDEAAAGRSCTMASGDWVAGAALAGLVSLTSAAVAGTDAGTSEDAANGAEGAADGTTSCGVGASG